MWIPWPGNEVWRTFFRCGLWLSFEWIVVYCGADWITSLHDYRFSLKTPLDFRIPFLPVAATAYLSLFPMIWMSPFVLNSPRRLQAFAAALGTVIAISGIGFLLIPVEAIDIHLQDPHDLPALFRFADWINLTYNSFPSLHVGMAVVCAIFYSRSVSLPLAILYWLWTALIAISTLLTRQHYLVDMLAGGLLGAIVAISFLPHVPASQAA